MENAPELFTEHHPDDPEVISDKVTCDGRVVSAGHSIAECLDFLFKVIWIFPNECKRVLQVSAV